MKLGQVLVENLQDATTVADSAKLIAKTVIAMFPDATANFVSESSRSSKSALLTLTIPIVSFYNYRYGNSSDTKGPSGPYSDIDVALEKIWTEVTQEAEKADAEARRKNKNWDPPQSAIDDLIEEEADKRAVEMLKDVARECYQFIQLLIKRTRVPTSAIEPRSITYSTSGHKAAIRVEDDVEVFIPIDLDVTYRTFRAGLPQSMRKSK